MGNCSVLSGLDFKMRFSIARKLRKAGAVSEEKAMVPKEIGLNMQEIGWLQYLAGGTLSSTPIKKTKDGRYYVKSR